MKSVGGVLCQKSQIIKDVVESAVSLEQSLTRLYVIAGDLNNAKLAQWVSQELHGYKEEKSVPEYRKKHGYFLVYSGINARYQVTNIPLPKDFLSSEIIEAISNITFYDGIHSIEQIAASEKGASRDFSETSLPSFHSYKRWGNVYLNFSGHSFYNFSINLHRGSTQNNCRAY